MARLIDTTISGDATISGNLEVSGLISGNIQGSNANATLDWNASTNLAEVGGITITATLPEMPSITYQQGTGISISDSTISFNPADAGTSGIVDFTNSNEIKAGSFNAYSDARLKENFKTFIPEKSILDLPIYKYDYINGAKNQIGCLAQDLQGICPEIVNEGSDGYLSIQESKIVYLLLDEIKKLRQEVDELKRR